jgi:hypothetical protein
LPLALLVLALPLVAAASAGAEPQAGGEQGKGGPVAADPDVRSPPTPSPPATQSAPDRPPAETQPKPEESPPADRGKSEGEAQPPEAKPEAGAPPKNLIPIAPEEAVGILGKKVYGRAGEDMGMVVEVLVDSDGRPRAAVIDFGGFLGVGSRKIAIDWELLQFRPADREQPVRLSLGRSEVQAAPEYKPSGQSAAVVAPPPSAHEPTPPDAEK